MMSFPWRSHGVGVDITTDGVRTVVLSEKKRESLVANKDGMLLGSARMEHHAVEEFSQGTVRSLFKTPNIFDGAAFRRALKAALGACRVKRGNIALSLPGETIKVVIRRFSALPESIKEMERMIRWNLTQTLKMPMEQARIIWQSMGVDDRERHVLLIQLSWEPVISQYEQEVRRAGFTPSLILSAPLSIFNFLAEAVPDQGGVICLVQYHHSVVMFVFNEGIPIFFKNMKTGYLGGGDGGFSQRCGRGWPVNDLEMIVQCYQADRPGDITIDTAVVFPSEVISPFDDAILQRMNTRKKEDGGDDKAGRIRPLFPDCKGLMSDDDGLAFTAALGAAKTALKL